MEDAPVFYGFKNIFITMFATFFFFKLLIKVSLALLTHFYIVKGNRKEAARIAEEIYGGISDNSGSTRYQWSYPRQSIKMLPLTGKSEKNFEVSGSIKWPGLWKAISFGDYICHTFQGDCWADRSPLHEAAAQGRLLALKTLISQGVNVNLMTINQVSSLHEACLGGHVACARVLLENGAQVNGVTIQGATPLFNACCNGSAACVSMLLEHGAKAQLDMHLCSPIHEAVKRGHIECMEILLANNVNIDQELPQLGTPLYVACTYEKENCLKKLLELGANPDQGQWLNTPLHAAARQSNLDIIYMLVDYGANLRLRNAQGKTPLDLAAPKSSVAEALILCEGPPTLSQLCRLRIRKCLGRTYRQTINQLHLPEPLERFLLYQ